MDEKLTLPGAPVSSEITGSALCDSSPGATMNIWAQADGIATGQTVEIQGRSGSTNTTQAEWKTFAVLTPAESANTFTGVQGAQYRFELKGGNGTVRVLMVGS